jgi:hypothetical protein
MNHNEFHALHTHASISPATTIGTTAMSETNRARRGCRHDGALTGAGGDLLTAATAHPDPEPVRWHSQVSSRGVSKHMRQETGGSHY